MAHAAAKTDEPIREGVVAGIGPFIDTIIICTISAMVILMTGAWNRPAVGTITSIDTDTNMALVACNADIPADMEALYLDKLHADGPLAVHVVRDLHDQLKTVSVPIHAVERSGERWRGVRTVTLDLSNISKPEERAAIAVGQPVHLDIAGAALTAFAFDTKVSGFGGYIVAIGVLMFAFSTMISWSYYGEKGAEYLLGPQAILPYKFVFVIFVFLGMVLPKFQTVVDFSDATTGLMVMCNLPAVLILSPVVLRAARDYFRRLDKGDMIPRR